MVANSRAMHAAISLADRLNAGSILEMHRALLEHSQPAIVGKFRDVHVWVGGRSPHTAQYVGPAPSRVPGLVEDLMQFTRRTDAQVLPQIAIAHAQFETIHPFPDGNGRTGRALVHAMLRASGATRQVTVPVSAGLLSDTGAYFEALTSYRTGNVAPIIRVFTDATFRSLRNSRRLVTDLESARQNWDRTLTARQGSAARRG
ncbi:MAG: Fic family protein [Gulosibacter sp.]|uniref:Fic family protein n=1 Tax=Gulosibacter sp. TaxID=2817531 RepID=UPI003F90E309